MQQAPTIADEQALIAEDFELFDDWREKIEYVLDLGRQLEPLPPADYTERNKVKGCQSQVWMVAELDARQRPAADPRRFGRLHRQGADRAAAAALCQPPAAGDPRQPAAGVRRDRPRGASQPDPRQRPACDDQAHPPAGDRIRPRRPGRRPAADRLTPLSAPAAPRRALRRPLAALPAAEQLGAAAVELALTRASSSSRPAGWRARPRGAAHRPRRRHRPASARARGRP